MTTLDPKEAREMPLKAIIRQSQLVLDVLDELKTAVESGHPADATLRRFFKGHREYGSRDRRFLSNAIFSCFRWQGWTDCMKMDTVSACVFAYLLDTLQPHPAISELQKKSALSDADIKPLGASSLSDKALISAQWLGRDEPMPIHQLIPSWVEETLHVPPDCNADVHGGQVIEAFQTPPPVWLRTPPGKRNDALSYFSQESIAARHHERLPNAIRVDSRFHLPTVRKAADVNLEIQDLASQCVGHICNPQPGQTWWDVCAGAGGKSLQLASVMNDSGRITATDIRETILRELRKRVRIAGIQSVHPAIMDVRKTLPDKAPFDGVLVDAPCSGLGTWARSPDARWRTNAEAVANSARLQSILLHRAAETVRPGGILVYAVCTLTKAETVDVIHSFLKDHSEFGLDIVPHPLRDTSTDGTIWIWPWDGPCTGMFIARMKRG